MRGECEVDGRGARARMRRARVPCAGRVRGGGTRSAGACGGRVEH